MDEHEAAAGQTADWRYAPLSEYVVPSEFTTEALQGFRRISRALWNGLRRTHGDEGELPERQRPSKEDLGELLPHFDVEPLATALEAALESWPEGDASERRIRAVVGPPGSKIQNVVASLASRRQWKVIAPPPRSELLRWEQTASEPLSGLEPVSGGPMVIPGLERWLMRSELGLPILRGLLSQLRDATSPVLIGCDSWAWSFLDRTLGIAAVLGEPLALSPLDEPKLDRWLGAPLSSRGFDCLVPGKENEAVFSYSRPKDSEKEEESDFATPALTKLAAAARGNPGLALELWKGCLGLARDATNEDDGDTGARAGTVWAAPLEESEVIVPATLESAHKFILHAALLHGGLDLDLLHAVLPFSRHDLRRSAGELAQQALVTESGGEVSVPLAAYAAVRQYLDDEGFLVDGF